MAGTFNSGATVATLRGGGIATIRRSGDGESRAATSNGGGAARAAESFKGRLCLYRGTISYFYNLVRMISVIDGSPRGYDFAITVKQFENTRQCPEIIPPLKI
jgi:hypothetical protein